MFDLQRFTEITVTTLNELQTAIGESSTLSSGDTIKLGSAITANETLTIAKSGLTLDLNGQTLTTSAKIGVQVKNGVAFTLEDSTATATNGIGNGEIKSTFTSTGSAKSGLRDKDDAAVIMVGENAGSTNNATFTMKSGKVSSDSTNLTNGGKLIGVDILGQSTFDMSGGSVKSSESLAVYFGTFGGSSTKGNANGQSGGGTFTMTGGKLESNSTSDLSTIQVSGNHKIKSTIQISGGEVVYNSSTNDSKSRGAIFSSGVSEITISDSATITSSHVGIEMRVGTLNVTGGTITSDASKAVKYSPTTYKGGASFQSGVAIAVAQHVTQRDVAVNISGGTISGYAALAVSNPNNVGTFGADVQARTGNTTVTAGDGAVSEDGTSTNKIGTVSVSVTGGTLESTASNATEASKLESSVYTVEGKNAILNLDSRLTINMTGSATVKGAIATTITSRESGTGYNITADSGNDFSNFNYTGQNLISYYQATTIGEGAVAVAIVGVANDWNKKDTDNLEYVVTGTGASNDVVASLAPDTSAGVLKLATTSTSITSATTIDLDDSLLKNFDGYNAITASSVTNTLVAFNIAGNDKITSIVGGAGNDSLKAGTVGATLDGGAGADSLVGGSGADVFVATVGSDTISNYEVQDRIQLASAPTAVTVEGSDVKFTVGSDNIVAQSAKDLAISVDVGEGASDSYQMTIDGITYRYASQNELNTAKEDLAAQIGDNYYRTFADALTAATSGDTIKVIKASDATTSITVDKAITLDLNGKKLSGAITVANGGNLTVSDSAGSGSITTSDDAITVESGGTVNIRGGKINSTGGRGISNNGYLNIFSGSIFGKVGIKMLAGALKLLGGIVRGRTVGSNNVLDYDGSVTPSNVADGVVTPRADAGTNNDPDGVGIDIAPSGSGKVDVTVGQSGTKSDIEVSGPTSALAIGSSSTSSDNASTINLYDGKYSAADENGKAVEGGSGNAIDYKSSNPNDQLTLNGAILESPLNVESTASAEVGTNILVQKVAVAGTAKTKMAGEGASESTKEIAALLGTIDTLNGTEYSFSGSLSDFAVVKVTGSSPSNVPDETGAVEPKDGVDAEDKTGTSYGSFKDAVASLQGNQTITFLKNIELNEAVSIGTTATLDFGNYNLTYKGDGNAAISLGSSATLSLSAGDKLIDGGIAIASDSNKVSAVGGDFGRLKLSDANSNTLFYKLSYAMDKLNDNETLTYAQNTASITSSIVSYSNDSDKAFNLAGISNTKGISITGGKNFSLTADNFTNASVASGGNIYTFYLSDKDETTGSGKSFTGSGENDKIINSATSLSILGGAGADKITNSGSSAIIYGGEDNDTVTNTGASAKIYGGAGNDLLVDNVASDSTGASLFGGEGNDILQASSVGSYLDGGLGDDSLKGGDGADTFVYSGGADSITGYTSTDSISLGDGFSVIKNGANVESLNGGLRLTFGTGNKLDFTDAISASIKSGSDTFVYTQTAISLAGGDSKSITLGSSYQSQASGNKTFNNTNNFTTINASAVSLSGDDKFIVNGGTSATYIVGAKTATSINSSAQSAKIYGGAEADKISVTGANAVINAGAGSNAISIGGASAFINVSDGSDTINVANNVTAFSLKGLTSNDLITFADSISNSLTSDGTLTLKIGSSTSSVTVYGVPKEGPSTDWNLLDGNYATFASVSTSGAGYSIEGSNSLRFKGTVETTGTPMVSLGGILSTEGFGADTTSKVASLNAANFADAGATVLSNADSYKFSLTGGDGTSFTGLSTGDTIYNAASNISINAGNGANYIENVSGDNVTLVGGSGADTFKGGSGADVFVYSAGKDKIDNFGTGDIITTTLDAPTAGNVTVDNNNYTFKFSSSNILTVNATSTPVSIKNSDGDTYIYDSNTIQKNTDAVTLTANYTEATYTATETQATIDGTLAKGATSSKLEIAGNAKANYIIGSSVVATSIDGGAMGDTLVAGTKGATLNGGAGDDSLVGGSGNDLFIYNDGADSIANYNSGNDIVSVVASENLIFPTTFNTAQSAYATYTGSHYVINFGGTDSLTVESKNAVTVASGSNTYYYKADRIEHVGNGVTLGPSFSSRTFNGASDDNSGYKTIDASATTLRAIRITGNDEANYIVGSSKGGTLIGGAANDTLESKATVASIGTFLNGGDGSDLLIGNTSKDTFAYTGGDDTINGYTSADLVSVASGFSPASDNISLSGSNLILGFDTTGSLTFEGVNNTAISLKSGRNTYQIQSDRFILGDRITLTSNLTTTDSLFNTDGIYNTIDASATSLDDGISIAGNENNNYIAIGKTGGSISGGAGNDTLVGGDGFDIFSYTAGKDVIQSFDSEKDKLAIEDVSTITKAKASSRRLTFTVENKNNTLTFNQVNDSVPTRISLSSGGYLTEDGYVDDTKKAFSLFSSARGTIDLNDSIYSGANISIASAENVKNQSVTLVGSSLGGSFTFAKDNKRRDGFEYGGGAVSLSNFEGGKDRLNLGNYAISAFSVGGSGNKDVALSLSGGDDNAKITLTGAQGQQMLIHQSTNKGSSYSKMVFAKTGVLYDKTKPTSATLSTGAGNFTAESSIRRITVGEDVKDISITANDNNNTQINASVAGGVTLVGGAKNDKFTGSADNPDLFIYTYNGTSSNKGGKDIINNFVATSDAISLGADSSSSILTSAKISAGNKSLKFKFGSKDILTVKGTSLKESQITINDTSYTYAKNAIINSNGTSASLTSQFGGTYKIADNVATVDGSLVEKKLTFKGTSGNETLSGGTSKTTFKGGGGTDSLAGGSGKDTFFYAKGDTGTTTIANFDFDNDRLKIANGTISRIASISGGDGIEFAMKNARAAGSPEIGYFNITSQASYNSSGKDTLKANAKKITASDVVIKANNTYYWFATGNGNETLASSTEDSIQTAQVGDLITSVSKVSSSAVKGYDVIDLNYATNLVRSGVAVQVTGTIPSKPSSTT